MPTLTLTASSRASYRGGSWSQTDFVQGYYENAGGYVYYGHCWFSSGDLTTLGNTINGSVVVDKVEFWFKRADTAHGSSAATSVRLHCSSKTSASGSVSASGYFTNGFLLGAFARGQASWVTIPLAHLNHLLNGYNGFGIYHENVNTSIEYSYYVRMNEMPQLRITYHYATSSATFSATSVNAGSSITMYIAAQSSAYSHTAKWTFGSNTSTQAISAGVSSSSFSIPLSWLIAIPNSTSGTATVTLTTLSDSTVVGTVTYSFTITAPSAVVPSLGTFSATRIDGDVPPAWGAYVQSKSKAQVSISGASGIYGSSIASYTITGAGYSASSSSLTTGFLLDSGSISFMGIVTDTRGRMASASISIDVKPYTVPIFSNVAALRCLSTGSEDDEGTYLKMLAYFACSSVDGKNSASCQVQYRQGSNGVLSSAVNLASGSAAVVGAGSIAVDASYEAVFTLTDAISAVTRVVDAGSAAYTMHFLSGGAGVAFGKAAEIVNCVEINSEWAFYAGGKNLAAITPAMIGAASSSHAHALADCTGTLAVTKGGTGATTAAAARTNLGVTLANLGAAASSHSHAASQITSGTLAADRLPYKFAYGSASVSGSYGAYIYYSGAGFTSVPKVFVNYSKTGSNWTGDNGCLKVHSKTTTQATIIVGGSFSTMRDIDWFAIGLS